MSFFENCFTDTQQSDRILFSIGEALVDMIPSRVGCSFDEVPAFSPRVGGAPANVCAAAARLGGRSALLSQLGDDPFGHKIARALAGCGVELSHLEFTSKEKQSVPDCWVSVKQFSKNDTATACQDWLRSTRLGRGSIKSHVRTVKVLGMGLFAFQERIHLWKGVTH